MKVFRLLALSAVIAAGLFGFRCSGGNDLYDLARNGVPLILATDGSVLNAYIAAENGYLKKVTVSTSYTSTFVGAFRLNERIYVPETDGYELYFHYYKDNSWSYVHHSLSSNPTARTMIQVDNKIIYADTSASTIYSFEGSSYTTLSSVTTPSAIAAIAWHDGNLYILGSDFRVYRYNYTPTATDTGMSFSTGLGAPLFFAISDNMVYVGWDGYMEYNALGEADPADSATTYSGTQSYAAYNSTAVYTAGYYSTTSSFMVWKQTGGSFAAIKSLPDTTGTISIAALSETKLAVGIYNSTANNGLYVLDTESGEMTRLSSDSISTVRVAR